MARCPINYKKWREANLDRIKSKAKSYREANKEKIRLNRIKNVEKRKKYEKDNKDAINKNAKIRRDNKRKLYEQNPELKPVLSEEVRKKRALSCLQWRKDNPEKVKQYRKNNKHKKTARENKRRAIKINASPYWSETEKIAVLYEKAKWLEELTGLKYHVDHIIPLKGKNVCGLHVWENLQILEASINISKGNK